MKNKIKKHIKVQLDQKTVITLKNIEKLKKWLDRFPQARVITA